MAWTIVGVSSVVETTTTTLTLTEPAGVADGDLLVACIACRTTATIGPSIPSNWNTQAGQVNNSTATNTSALASGFLTYQVRNGAPALTWTLPAGISVAIGRIVAYRGVLQTPNPADTNLTSRTTATNTTSV